MTTRVLFVCLGNICRSPLGEGAAADVAHLAVKHGVAHRFEVDSAGTGGYHAGERADPRMRAVAADRGVTLTSRARQVQPGDFARFDHIVCMDESNRAALLDMGAPAQKVRLLLSFHPASSLAEVPDPYFGGAEGFETVYHLVHEACEELLDALHRQPRAQGS